MTRINELDLAFIVDTTGSMGGLIRTAQEQMIAMIQALTQSAEVDIRLGVVEYRDHPPQDTLVYRAHPFTDDLQSVQATILGLKAEGGGDTPEAVLDGVRAACDELRWRAHARRLAVLIGDAPPHLGGRGDSFPAGCPCGDTIERVTARAEEVRITLYALGLTRSVAEPFGLLSQLTGGELFMLDYRSAMERLKAILAAEFNGLEFDRRVLEAWNASPGRSLDELAVVLESSRPAVSIAMSRLGSRGLI